MTTVEIHWLILALVSLIALSAVFSAAEIGVMSINRYRLRHLAKSNKRSAKRVVKLLKRPERVLGAILLGNTFSNILASAVATVIAVFYMGEYGVWISTIALTLIILIFAEAMPKTFAAVHPERAAFALSGFLMLLLRIVYPFVWVINAFVNTTLKLFGVRVVKKDTDPLSAGELRQVVSEASGKISANYQHMLLRILDLERITVDDIMVPRNDIYGIDLLDDWNTIIARLINCSFSHVVVYRETLDQLQGVLLVRNALSLLVQQQLNKEKLMALIEPIHFIPKGTLLGLQLRHFQQLNQYLGLIVDEYGDIQGLVNIDDVLEEIVGEFAEDMADSVRLIKLQNDGSYLADASIQLRVFNRLTRWHLPIEGPKTLSGLIVERLEMFPHYPVCLRVDDYIMEVGEIVNKRIKRVTVSKRPVVINLEDGAEGELE